MQMSYACRCFHFQYMRQTNVWWILFYFFVITASPVSGKMGPTGSVAGSPKPFNPGLVPKQERTAGTGGILNLNLGQYQQAHMYCNDVVIKAVHQHVALSLSCLVMSNLYWNRIFTCLPIRSGEGWDGSEGAEWNRATTTAAKSATAGRVSSPHYPKETYQEPGQDYWELQGTAWYMHNHLVIFWNWRVFSYCTYHALLIPDNISSNYIFFFFFQFFVCSLFTRRI